MDIYLLRDGKEIGPFTEETTQSFLKQGEILIDDLAWTPGMAAWSPLVQVLYPVAPHSVAAAPVEPVPAGEFATAKQKAFLSYIGVAFSSDTTKGQAAVLVNEAMENPELNARVLQWNDDRLKLHPDLFAAEAKAKKDDRANRFFESCQREGADRLTGVTKAHCQVLIGYLDVNFPNWDAHESEAAWSYFFPAVAEKFPQLVQKAWRGKLKYPDGPKVAPEIIAQAQFAMPRTGPSPLAALVRGIVFGLALLLSLYIAVEMFSNDTTEPVLAAVEPDPVPVNQSAPPKTATAPVRDTVLPERSKVTQEPAATDANMAATVPPAEPPTTVVPDTDPAPAEIAPKTMLVITKATDVRLRLGIVKLPVGKQLKIVAQEGALVKAIYEGETVTLPVDATDLAAPLPDLQ